jgi:hypothetical protein
MRLQERRTILRLPFSARRAKSSFPFSVHREKKEEWFSVFRSPGANTERRPPLDLVPRPISPGGRWRWVVLFPPSALWTGSKKPPLSRSSTSPPRRPVEKVRACEVGGGDHEDPLGLRVQSRGRGEWYDPVSPFVSFLDISPAKARGDEESLAPGCWWCGVGGQRGIWWWWWDGGIWWWWWDGGVWWWWWWDGGVWWWCRVRGTCGVGAAALCGGWSGTAGGACGRWGLGGGCWLVRCGLAVVPCPVLSRYLAAGPCHRSRDGVSRRRGCALSSAVVAKESDRDGGGRVARLDVHGCC